MKWIAEYLESAIKFEHLAGLERNPEVRAKLEAQAAAYRSLGRCLAAWLWEERGKHPLRLQCLLTKTDRPWPFDK